MPPRNVHAESSELTPEDRRKRKLASDLIRAQNDRLVTVAKQLGTLAFSAIGVVLSLREKWLGQHPAVMLKSALGIAAAMYLVAVVLAMFAAGIYVFRISRSDYGDVDNELLRVAATRYRLCLGALIGIVLATIAVAFVALTG